VVQAQSANGTPIDGLSVGYEFDAVGNLKRLRDGNQGEPPLRTYGYDGLDRLTEAKDATDVVWQSYGYDRTGNRTHAGRTEVVMTQRKLPLIPDTREVELSGIFQSGGFMKKSKFSETQIVSMLKQGDAGVPVKDLCRQAGISPATYYQWKSKYGGLEASDLKRVKELEAENAKLKRLYAELALDNAAMKELIAKKL
jgi:putative transposase